MSRKFKDFLLKYVGDSDSNKMKFNAYYTKRSKIVHSGRLLQSEKLFNSVSDEVFADETKERVEILQIGKIALANWLFSNPHRENRLSEVATKLLG